MSAYAFVNYVRFKSRTGGYQGVGYQNFSINEVRAYGSVNYSFAPFAITTGGGVKGGDKAEAALVAGTNEITVNLFAEAVKNEWLLEIKTVALDPFTYEDGQLITDELYRVASYQMDNTKVSLKLTSPLDAVKASAPRRTLSTALVGALPTSGSLAVG
jgi:hypothetical protein